MLRPLAFTLIVTFLAPATAAAQFGNLTKKAKEKAAAEAAKAAGIKPAESSGKPKFDNTILELTPPVVNQAIAGLKVRANTKDANGRSSAELRRRADELYKEAEELNRDRSDERFEYNNKAGNARSCRDDHMREAKDKAMQAAQQKMMSGQNLNMTFMNEFGRLSGEMGQAVAAGDTAKARQLDAELYKLLGYDIKAEKAKAEAACGMPKMPAWMARADSVGEESTKLYNQARALEEKSNAEAVKASGMTSEQFMMAIERLTAYLQTPHGQYLFTQTEDQAIKTRLAEIKPLVG